MEYQHGGDIYSSEIKLDYSANINPFGMPSHVRSAVKDALDSCVHYPDSQFRNLREAISEHHQIPGESVICANGAADVIFQTVFAKRPKKAMLTAPTFSEYEQALNAVDCLIVYYELTAKRNFYLEMGEFIAGLDPSIDMVFLCNPNNPTGHAVSKSDVGELLNYCMNYGIFLVVDECFCDFMDDENDYSVISQVSVCPQLLVVRAFTKMYGMAGIRLGYGLCSDRTLLLRMEEMRQPWSVSTLAQAAGIAALQETGYAEKTRNYIREERICLKQQLEDLGFHVYDSKANYLFFKDMGQVEDRDLYRRCKERQLLIRSCGNYRGLDGSYYRICVKLREENIRFLQILREILASRHA